MAWRHGVPTIVLPKNKYLSSSSEICASCLYSICMFAEHIHQGLFMALGRPVPLNESERSFQSKGLHEAGLISGTFPGMLIRVQMA